MRSVTVFIKPLSINQAFKGRRFKTPAYVAYEQELLLRLPNDVVIPEGKLKVRYSFGVSSRNADFDNVIKLFQDILQKKYGFNDRRIYEAEIVKEIVKKGEEFVAFKISSL